jgi:small conductance mechanosensitive channel
MFADVLADWIDRVGGRLLDAALRIGLVALLMAVVLAMIRRAAARLQGILASRLPSPSSSQRAATIGHVVRDGLRTLVWAVGGLLILGEVGLDLKPLLAAAGIGGLAIGFGAQSLVKDLIAGFFLLFDDRVRVGDVVELAGVSGVVEEIRLRTTVLRDLAGSVHVIPNGSVDRVKNMTRDHAFAVVDVEVAYREDPDAVARLLEDVGRGLAADPTFGPSLRAPLEVLGVEALGENGVSLRFRQRTAPGEQWRVARELRRRVKGAFDEASIEFPFPQRTLWMGAPASGAAPPLRVARAARDERGRVD